MNEPRNFSDPILGWVVLTCLVAPHVYWVFLGYINAANWQFALWAFFAGGVFFLSFFFRERTFVFRGILWVLRTIHIPPGEWFAIVYGALFFVIGLFYLTN